MDRKLRESKDPRSFAWYYKDIQEVPKEIRPLFEHYAHIPQEEVVNHVLNIRSKGFDVCPYPCIGQFRFLVLTLNGHPLYPQVVDRLKRGETLLDMGCCFGQDLRQLVADGVPSENIYGLDVERPLIDLGYDLFMDRDKLRSTFVVRDVFDKDADWSPLEGKMDIIHASAFFHLFPWPKQAEVGRVLVRLARLKSSSIIIGRQMGSLTPGEFPSMVEGSTGYRHNVDSLQRLWDEVGAMTGSRWTVEGTLDTVALMGIGELSKDSENKSVFSDPNMRRLLFTIRRE